MKKTWILAALLGVFAGMLLHTPIVEATSTLIVYTANIAASAVTTSKIAAGAVIPSKMGGATSAAIPIGNPDGGASFIVPTGDVTITGAGVTAIGKRKVTPATMIGSGVANSILVGDPDGGVGVYSVGGDLTSASPGVITIAAGKVLPSKFGGGTSGALLQGNVDGGASYVAISGSVNHVICWKTATTLGYCSTAVNADGGICTCN